MSELTAAHAAAMAKALEAASMVHEAQMSELRSALAAFPVAESDWSPPKPWELDGLFGGEETGPPIAESARRDPSESRSGSDATGPEERP